MTSRKFGEDCVRVDAQFPTPLQKFLFRFIFFPLVAAILIAGTCVGARADGQQSGGKCPPTTRKDDVVDTLHGVKIADPYRWLEDQNSPETRAWIEAQDACTRAVLDAVPGRAKITARLSQLMKVESVNPPIERNGVYV